MSTHSVLHLQTQSVMQQFACFIISLLVRISNALSADMSPPHLFECSLYISVKLFLVLMIYNTIM